MQIYASHNRNTGRDACQLICECPPAAAVETQTVLEQQQQQQRNISVNAMVDIKLYNVLHMYEYVYIQCIFYNIIICCVLR